jgi:hypothetical protein
MWNMLAHKYATFYHIDPLLPHRFIIEEALTSCWVLLMNFWCSTTTHNPISSCQLYIFLYCVFCICVTHFTSYFLLFLNSGSAECEVCVIMYLCMYTLYVHEWMDEWLCVCVCLVSLFISFISAVLGMWSKHLILHALLCKEKILLGF